MSNDGASQGYNAEQAMRAIVGGEDPGAPEADSTAAMARRVMGTHLLDVRRASQPGEKYDDGAYGRMADWTAHMYVDTAMLLGHFPEDIYRATKERLGEGTVECDELQGISGFMHGWAQNAARTILELPEVPNPALLTIELPE